jgi:hypothetical protein
MREKEEAWEPREAATAPRGEKEAHHCHHDHDDGRRRGGLRMHRSGGLLSRRRWRNGANGESGDARGDHRLDFLVVGEANRPACIVELLANGNAAFFHVAMRIVESLCKNIDVRYLLTRGACRRPSVAVQQHVCAVFHHARHTSTHSRLENFALLLGLHFPRQVLEKQAELMLPSVAEWRSRP